MSNLIIENDLNYTALGNIVWVHETCNRGDSSRAAQCLEISGFLAPLRLFPRIGCIPHPNGRRVSLSCLIRSSVHDADTLSGERIRGSSLVIENDARNIPKRLPHRPDAARASCYRSHRRRSWRLPIQIRSPAITRCARCRSTSMCGH